MCGMRGVRCDWEPAVGIWIFGPAGGCFCLSIYYLSGYLSVYMYVYIFICVLVCVRVYVCVCASRALVTGGSVGERLPLLVRDTIDRGRSRRW